MKGTKKKAAAGPAPQNARTTRTTLNIFGDRQIIQRTERWFEATTNWRSSCSTV